MKKKLRSRIKQHFQKSLLEKISRICKTSEAPDNNTKVDEILALLDDYKIDYVELGPGTNRLAVLIENYVFKIAMDRWGILDNINEFAMSKELQPFVVKTYETNELISVCEYVTVISKEEFVENAQEIRRILGILAESYLLGDVGLVTKNFCNWGYRDDGELVILDFAYVYRIRTENMLCSKENCGTVLEYDRNFNSLHCPKCRKKYTFMDVRRRISMKEETQEHELAKKHAYCLTKDMQVLEIDEEGQETKNKTEEETDMMEIVNNKLIFSKEEQEDAFDNAMDVLNRMKAKSKIEQEGDVVKGLIKEKVDEAVNDIDDETEVDITINAYNSKTNKEVNINVDKEAVVVSTDIYEEDSEISYVETYEKTNPIDLIINDIQSDTDNHKNDIVDIVIGDVEVTIDLETPEEEVQVNVGRGQTEAIIYFADDREEEIDEESDTETIIISEDIEDNQIKPIEYMGELPEVELVEVNRDNTVQPILNPVQMTMDEISYTSDYSKEGQSIEVVEQAHVELTCSNDEADKLRAELMADLVSEEDYNEYGQSGVEKINTRKNNWN